MDPRLAGFIALALVLGLAAQLSAGEIRLHLAPQSWQGVSKDKDPGRFWAFIVAEILLLGVVLTAAVIDPR